MWVAGQLKTQGISPPLRSSLQITLTTKASLHCVVRRCRLRWQRRHLSTASFFVADYTDNEGISTASFFVADYADNEGISPPRRSSLQITLTMKASLHRVARRCRLRWQWRHLSTARCSASSSSLWSWWRRASLRRCRAVAVPSASSPSASDWAGRRCANSCAGQHRQRFASDTLPCAKSL